MECSAGKEFALHADIFNLGSGLLATDCMSFLQSPGTQGQNTRPNRLIHKFSMNTVIFVNATIGFSEKLLVVMVDTDDGWQRMPGVRHKLPTGKLKMLILQNIISTTTVLCVWHFDSVRPSASSLSTLDCTPCSR